MSDHCNTLEWYVVELLKRIDPRARPSKASGASTEPYDIQTKLPYAFECKQQLTHKDAVIKKDTWDKLKAELPWNSNRVPVLVIENKAGNRFAVLDLEYLVNLIEKVEKKEEANG